VQGSGPGNDYLGYHAPHEIRWKKRNFYPSAKKNDQKSRQRKIVVVREKYGIISF
jgi:hypothetical protein